MSIPRYVILAQKDVQEYDFLISKILEIRQILHYHSGESVLPLLESAAHDLLRHADRIREAQRLAREINVVE